MNELVVRVLTSSVLLLSVLVILFYLPAILFLLSVWAVLIVVAFEWARLVKSRSQMMTGSLLGAITVLSIVMMFVHSSRMIFSWVGIGAWLAIFVLMIQPIGREYFGRLSGWWGVGVGILYLMPGAAGTWALFQSHPGKLLYVLSIVWVSDSSAYLIGSRWGKTPLAVAISPKKTWEGMAGALGCVAVYVVCLGALNYLGDVSLWIMLFWGIMIAALSVGGDLFESALKRANHTKDSGTWLPGHGGLLDRIDALLPVLPLAAVLEHFGMM